MAINRYFDLYLNAGQAIPPTIHVNQYDKGEYWFFTLYDENGNKFVPTSASIVGRKADKKAVTTTAVISGEYVRVTETEQMTAAAGKATFELKLDNNHGTANFIVDVEPAPVDDNADYSATDLTLIQRGITAAQEAIDAAASIDGDLNGWTFYSPDDFPKTTPLASVCGSMSGKSIFITDIATPATDYGGVPVAGVLIIIKRSNSRTVLFNQRSVAAGSNVQIWSTTYSSTNSTIMEWEKLAVGSNAVPGSLNGVRCLLIGNSFARGSGGVTDRQQSDSKAGKGWPYYFKEVTGCDAKIIEQSGGDFVAVGNDRADYVGKTYLEAVTEYAGTLTDEQKEAFKLLIVGGGYNDFASSSATEATIRSAIYNFINYCRTAFPNAKIWIIPLMQSSGYRFSGFYSKVRAWVNAPVDFGVCGSATSADWFLNTSGYDADEPKNPVHLNDAGYKRCGSLIASLVQGWDGERYFESAPVHVIYNANGLVIHRIGTEVTVSFQSVTSLPSLETIDATAGGIPWVPKVPNAQYFPIWDYANGRMLYLTVNASGFSGVRTVDKETVDSYQLYGTLKWNSNY